MADDDNTRAAESAAQIKSEIPMKMMLAQGVWKIWRESERNSWHFLSLSAVQKTTTTRKRRGLRWKQKLKLIRRKRGKWPIGDAQSAGPAPRPFSSDPPWALATVAAGATSSPYCQVNFNYSTWTAAVAFHGKYTSDERSGGRPFGRRPSTFSWV